MMKKEKIEAMKRQGEIIDALAWQILVIVGLGAFFYLTYVDGKI